MIDGLNNVFNDLVRHIGQTVTIFTTSGGLSGGGFTGVLISIDNCVVRLLVCEGAAPCCAVGSSCGTPSGFGFDGGWGGIGLGGWGEGRSGIHGFNPMGGVVVIPFPAIAAFVHHAI